MCESSFELRIITKPDILPAMHFVYILESADAHHWYVGLTNNLERRLSEHRAEHSIHTHKFDGWSLKTYVAFNNRAQAMRFERYLKSHSGRAFTKKHF